MKSITGSILVGFGMLSLVMLKVNNNSVIYSFNPFRGLGYFSWGTIIDILPVVAIVAGIVLMFLGFNEKKQ